MKLRFNDQRRRRGFGHRLIHRFAGTDSRWLALLVVLAGAATAWPQQTVTVQSQPVRVSVSDLSTSTTSLANQVNFGGTGTDPVNLKLSGLPTGAGYSYDVSAFTASGAAALTLFTTNPPKGEYVVGIEATGGATNRFLLTLQSGRMWTGDTNLTGNWSAPSSWVGGVVPGPTDDVLFTQLGAQTILFTNSVVDADMTIASLRFLQTNGNARFHTLEIQPGRTLSVTGTNGLRLLRDNTGIGAQMDANITGPGGKLVVSNASATVAVLIDNQQTHRFDLSGLGTFVADVSRVALGDFRAYPNYTNLTANGFGGNASFLIPRRFIPSVRLARTNIIRAVYTDPNNYLDPGIRNYSLTFENNDVGTTADGAIWFGISNAFFLDSICLVQSSSQAEVANEIVFNAAFATNNPVAYFRGTNGGRMSVFAIADAAGPGASGTSTKALVDFTRGSVDAMVDRLYMGRDRTNSSDNANGEATMTLAAGTFNVNTAILGFQGNGNNQNFGTNGTPIGYARGTLNVISNAVFVVNNVLELGHTTADPADLRQAEQGYGQININNGGKVMANAITVGGVTKVSRLNNITLTGGSTLIISNTLAGPDKKLTALNLTDSTLVLHVNGATTDPYVYVTNLVTTGSGNVIQLASVTNVSSFPATITLLSYESATPTLTLKVPTGLSGYIQNNGGSKTIEAVLSSVTPKTVIWRGNQSATWDTSALNWIDATTLTPTNFNNGDFAIFDDSATGPTSIAVSGSVLSGQSTTVPGVTISNVTKNYTFAGGTVAGTGTMLKQGAGSLTMNATSENPLTLREGAVTGSGGLGATTISAGTTLTFTGTISGITSTGTVTLASSGAINGPVAIRGGSFVNSGTVNTAPGALTINPGGAVTNQASGIMSIQGVSTVASNGVLANFGRINNLSDRMNVNGLLLGTGTVSDQTFVAGNNQGRLAINAGATFSPGASIGTFVVEGRLDLNQAASGNPAGRLVIEVDMNHPQKNDMVSVDKWSNIRGTIVMTNIGTVPFALGQSFQIVTNNFGLLNTPEIANLDYTIQPAAPGPGLAWDVSNLVSNGIVAIVESPINPTPTNVSFLVSGSNLTLSWPSDHIGWQLQVQTNQVALGLSTNPADWQIVANSQNTNQVIVPIDRVKPTTFYRMILP